MLGKRSSDLATLYAKNVEFHKKYAKDYTTKVSLVRYKLLKRKIRKSDLS